jgi:hypothetical protein
MILDDFRNLRQSFFAKAVIGKTTKVSQIKNGFSIQQIDMAMGSVVFSTRFPVNCYFKSATP